MLAIKRLDLGGVSVGSVHVAVSYTKTIQQLGFVYEIFDSADTESHRYPSALLVVPHVVYM
jgi:hypothetical protein